MNEISALLADKYNLLQAVIIQNSYFFNNFEFFVNFCSINALSMFRILLCLILIEEALFIPRKYHAH